MSRIGFTVAALCWATLACAVEHGEPTTIEQRDDAGVVRVRRQVRLNARGDFENHGTYREWSAAGELLGQGRYASGQRTGVWRRWAAIEETPDATAASLYGFESPVLSESHYRDGRLTGEWRVCDAAGRVALAIEFDRGQRHGVAVFFAADTTIVRRSRFERGVPVGPVERGDTGGRLAVVADYHAGRERTIDEEAYPNGARRSRQEMLGPVVRISTPDDPWALMLATYAEHGEPIRHGSRTVWYARGQRKHASEYVRGKPVGESRWWRSNGQLAASGAYDASGATGVWRWWGENGLLTARAEYRGGQIVGQLSAWDALGRCRAGQAAGLSPAVQLANRAPERVESR
ncbi:MAG: hypothetical protein AAFV43_11630 [Planctomycetota bacterium]